MLWIGPAIWPVAVQPGWKPSKSGKFGAARPDDMRHHEGTDLPAKTGDKVVAPMPGTVTGITGWDGEGKAVYLRTSLGTFILAPMSVSVKVKQVVAQGEQLGTIVPYPGGDQMLHLELWLPNSGVTANKRPPWPMQQGRPIGAVDAFLFLKLATVKQPSGKPAPKPSGPPHCGPKGSKGWPTDQVGTNAAWGAMLPVARGVVLDYTASRSVKPITEGKTWTKAQGPYWLWVFDQAIRVALPAAKITAPWPCKFLVDEGPLEVELRAFADSVHSEVGDAP